MRRLYRGFTLMELAIVLAVSGMMLGFVLKAIDAGPGMNTAQCAAVTKGRVQFIQAQVERFARSNDRLPAPARRWVGSRSATYGREAPEASLTTIDPDGVASNGDEVLIGALPWQALDITSDFAGDCWGNKYTYMVRKALTTSASSGGFLDATIDGNITRKISSTVSGDTKLAYVVISHGPDQLGAVKLDYDDSAAGTPDRKWCSGSTNIAYTNCLATTAVLMDAELNNGESAGSAYFDDIVAAAGKPKKATVAVDSNAYCWGYNGDGAIGDGTTTTPRKTPTLVTGNIQFAQLTTGINHTCGLDQTGKPYCWGDNTFGQLGDGTSTRRTSPTAVSGGHTFTQIRAGYYETCALNTSGAAYCWGYGASLIGTGASSTNYVPTAVSGGLTFSDISAGFTSACGVRSSNGAGYCWGYNESGQLGVGDTTSRTAGPVTISGGLTLRKIYAGYRYGCAITTGGDAYCWGDDNYGQLGNGAPLSASYVPVLVSGGYKFQSLSLGQYGACGLTTSNVTYCWGDNGQNNMGIGSTSPSSSATPLPQSSPQTFIQINRVGFGGCGLTSDYRVYCWGINNHGQVGDDTTTQRTVPTLTYTAGTWPNVFGSLAFGNCGTQSHQCALQPLPPAAWGYNNNGQVGDGTTTNRTTPVYVSMPSGVKYFKNVAAGGQDSYSITNCAISEANNGYCWGTGTSYGNIGDGSTSVNKTTPTAVTMPSGITFSSINPGWRYTCAKGSDNKLYCWGASYYFYTSGASNSATPVYVPIAPTTISSIDNNWVEGWGIVGSNGRGYYPNGWAISLDVLPGANATIKKFVNGPSSSVSCVIGADDQVYCRGVSETYSAIGNSAYTPGTPGTCPGASCSTASYVAVTNPVGVTSYKALSMGTGSGWSFPCAIGNNDQLYCWGSGGSGMLGNGGATSYVPYPVTLPTGVLSWKQVRGSERIQVAQGDNGEWYYWGHLNGDVWGSWGGDSRKYVPTLMPLPPGASGWRYIDGRVGIPY